MKKATAAVLLAGLVGLFSLAADVLSFKGEIVDNMCAAENKDNLADFLKTHTKECALMSECVASGYSIFADGKLHKFDQASNKKIEEFLRKPDSKLQVVVKAERVGKELKLVSIENQE
ncbi:MAG: hypothetical protein A2W20_07300 [Candidatus Aminicenantes bacterium RBG_16_66_30]|nr:MAG: hypothetical protein A2W20_07300 [Candidatus Aminicenantes bacterium RBG_16_66_30]